MEINFTPVKTCINYGINAYKINEQVLPNFKLEPFKNFKAENLVLEDLKKLKQFKINKPLSQEFFNLSINNNNFAKIINFNKTKDNSVLEFNFENNLELNNILEINVKENISANLILKFNSKDKVFNNSVIKLNLLKNSNLKVILYNNLNQDSNNFFTIENNLKEGSNLEFNIIDFSCKNSVFNIYTNHSEDSAVSNINCCYLADKESFIDLNILNDLFGKKSNTNINCVGVLFDNARKNFKATINFAKGAKKSVGNEDDYCMLLSKTAKSKSLPMLLCLEEDVDGKHSTSVGKVDEKQLFYIMSRGIDYTEALKLIVKARLNNLLEFVFDSNLKEEIINKIDRKIELYDRY